MSIRLKSLYCFLFSFTVYVTLYIGQGQGKQDSVLTPATDFFVYTITSATNRLLQKTFRHRSSLVKKIYIYRQEYKNVLYIFLLLRMLKTAVV